MKTILRFLSVLAVMFFIACSEDIYLHDGEDGKDGKDGYSTLMFFDPIAQMKVYYLDEDASLTFTSGDLVLYSENKEGLKVVTAGGGCYNLIQVSGLTEILVGTICNGAVGATGPQGQAGNDAHNIVFASKPFNDEAGVLIGNIIEFYWDMDAMGEPGYGILSAKDILKFVTPVIKNGIIGPMGPMGPTGPAPVFNVDIVINANNWVITFTVNNSTTSMTIPKPEDGTIGPQGPAGSQGPIGITPSVIVTQKKNGTLYKWFADLDNNGKIDEGEKVIAYYFVSNNSTEPIVALSYFWDFIGQTSCTSYVENGWKFSNGAGVSDGNAYIQGAGSIATQIFRDNLNLLSMTFLYGSSVTRNIKVVAIMSDNSEKIIDEFLLEGIPGFKVNEYSRYKLFEYYADVNSMKFKGVKRIRIETSCPQKCIPTDLLIKQLTLDFADTNVH